MIKEKAFKEYTFTTDWFSNNISRWERHVKPHLLPKKDAAKVLIVGGSHEGQAPIWLFENLPFLKHVDIIDRFSPGKGVYERFKSNLKPFEKRIGRCTKVKTALKEGLTDHQNKTNYSNYSNYYDFIYLDGMQAQELLEMLVLTFPMLKPRGLLICDDNTNSKEHLPNCPKPAIEAFMYIYSPWLMVKELSWQAIMIKRVKPLVMKECRSEYYHNQKT